MRSSLITKGRSNIHYCKMINVILDKLIVDEERNFKKFLLASVLFDLGGKLLDGNLFGASVPNFLVTTVVGKKINTEPVSMQELKQYKQELPEALLLSFHSRAAQYWQDCLKDLFCYFVKIHLDGKRQFIELTNAKITLNLSSSANLQEQINECLMKFFEFEEYAERVRIINKILNPHNSCQDELTTIKKNIFIRNSFEHREGIIDRHILKKLGTDKIEILDQKGQPIYFRENDKIILSTPEFDNFKRSILVVSQEWRKNSA